MSSVTMRGQNDALVHTYKRGCRKKLCNSTTQKTTNCIFHDLLLQDYTRARSIDYHSQHSLPGLGCEGMLTVAHGVM